MGGGTPYPIARAIRRIATPTYCARNLLSGPNRVTGSSPLTKFITTASEFFEKIQHDPEVGEPGSDPPEHANEEADEEQTAVVLRTTSDEQSPEELHTIRTDEAQASMEATERRNEQSFQWPSSPPTAQRQLIRLTPSPDLPVAPLPTATNYDDWADQVEKASGMITSEEEDDADLYSRPKQPVFCQPPAAQSRTEDVDDAYLHSRPVRPIFCPPPTSPLSSPIRPNQRDTPEPEPVDNWFRDYGVDHDIELYDVPRAAIFRPPPMPDDNDHKMDLDSREVSLGHASSPMRGVRFGGQERGTEQASPMADVRGEHSPLLDRDVPMEDKFRDKAMALYH
jgi:hypothetical protein